MLLWNGCLVMEEKIGLGGGYRGIYSVSFWRFLYDHSLFDSMSWSFERAGGRVAVPLSLHYVLFCCLALVIEEQTILCSWTCAGLGSMLIPLCFHIPTFILYLFIAFVQIPDC
jgi:hypothetical protein